MDSFPKVNFEFSGSAIWTFGSIIRNFQACMVAVWASGVMLIPSGFHLYGSIRDLRCEHVIYYSVFLGRSRSVINNLSDLPSALKFLRSAIWTFGVIMRNFQTYTACSWASRVILISWMLHPHWSVRDLRFRISISDSNIQLVIQTFGPLVVCDWLCSWKIRKCPRSVIRTLCLITDVKSYAVKSYVVKRYAVKSYADVLHILT